MHRIVITIICLLLSPAAGAYEIVGADKSTLERVANDPTWFNGAVGFSAKDIKGFRAAARAELESQQSDHGSARGNAHGVPPVQAAVAQPQSKDPAQQAVQQVSAPQANAGKP